MTTPIFIPLSGFSGSGAPVTPSAVAPPSSGVFVLGGPAPSAVGAGGSTPPPPATVFPTPVGRLQRLFQNFFEAVPFAGRKPRPVGKFLYVPPPPVVPQLPNPTRNRILRAFQNFFEEPPYQGRNAPRFNYGGGIGLPAKASQIVYEALVFASDPAVRASQTIREALIQDTAQVRAGQAVVEALYQQSNPHYVRAGQVVVEVLVPYVEFPVIPVYPELSGLTFDPFIKRPKYSTGVGVGSSGREVRIGYWANPQWEWDLKYDTLGDSQSTWNYQGGTASDLKTLMGFVLSRYGAQAPFYFRDPDDYQATGQLIGQGDGTTKQFVFERTYGLGDFTGTEPVGSVNLTETVAIYLDGVLQTTGFTINTETPCGNFVIFDTAPGAGVNVTADFQYYFYCRFKDDSTDFEKFLKQMWENQKITIFSLKN